MILLRRPRFWLALLLAIAAGLFVTALPQQPRVTLPYAGNIDSKSLTAELWLMLIWAGKDFAFTPDSQQIAVVTERPKVEAGLVTKFRERETRAERLERLDADYEYDETALDRKVVAKDQIRTIIRTFRPGRRTISTA